MKNSILAIALLLLIIIPVVGQTPNPTIPDHLDYEKPRDYTIADIVVTGVKFLQTQYLINISGLTVGQEISVPGESLTKAINKFWTLGLFSDVKIIATKTDGKLIFLEIQLTEQPRLSKLKVQGLNKNDTKDVEEKIKLKPGNQITENVLNNTVTIIKKHFVDKGFFKCKVDFFQRADTSPGNKVFLDITVDKGKRVKISDINFIGNQAFKDSRLKRTMNTKKIKRNSSAFTISTDTAMPK
jgi:outer membrane protein insertion porin family